MVDRERSGSYTIACASQIMVVRVSMAVRRKLRGGSRIFYTLVKHVVSAFLGGSGGIPPCKMFEVWVSEMAFPTF